MFGSATLVLWLALGQAAPAEGGPNPPECYPAQQAIVVDGDLGDWDRRGPIKIAEPWQRNLIEGNALSRDWQGPEDSSATIYLAYDSENLYVAGEVKDDLRLHDDKVWWSGDCLELFLDLDRDGDRDDPAWNEDDYQICLMPYFPGRPWGVSKHGPATLLSDEKLQGIAVASRQRAAAGYSFEARLAFKDFKSFDPAARKLGFNLALNDHDQLADGGRRHTYLTVNGAAENQLDTRNLLDVSFIGEAKQTSPSERDWGAEIGLWVVSLLASLLIIALVAWTSRPLFEWVNARLRSWRRIGLWVLLFLLFAVFGAPFLVARFLEWRVEGRFDVGASAVGKIVADLAEELRCHEGRGLDTPERLLDLLRGTRVRTRPLYDYTCFELRSREEDPHLRVSAEGVSVRNYGFVVAAGRQLSLPLPEPTALAGLYVFGSARFDDRVVQRPGASSVRAQALEIGVRMADGTERSESFPAIDRSRLGGGGVPMSDRFSLAFVDNGRAVEQYFVGGAMVGDELVKAVLITLREPGVEFRLHGVSYARADAAGEPLPLSLAHTSLAGPPAALWDGIPRGVARVAAGASGRVSVPIGKALDTLWFFYNTADPSVLDAELSGVEVGRFLVRDLAGAEIAVIPLRAGVNLTFGQFDDSQRPAGMESALAFRWEAAGASQLIEVLERRVSSPGGPVEVAEVVLENGGELSGISLFAVTGGVLGPPVRPGGGSALQETSEGLALLPSQTALVHGLDLAVLEGGLVAAVDFRDRELGASLKGSQYPLGGIDAAEAGAGTLGVTLADEPYLVRGFHLAREEGPSLSIAAAQKVHGLAFLWRMQRLVGIASLFVIIPLLLFYVMDRTTRIARLRLRLTTILIATSLAPIVILFAVLYNVVASDRARLRESQGSAAMQEVLARLGEMFRQTQRTAREIMDSDLVQEIREGGELDRARIESYLQQVVVLRPAPGLDLAVRLEVEAKDGLRRRFHDGPGRESASSFDLTEGGIHYHWGQLVFLWPVDSLGRENELRVVVAGEVMPGLANDLGRATSTRVALLTLRGFPIAGSASGDPEVRARDVEGIRLQNRLAFRANAAGELLVSGLLRGPRDDPAALVEVALPPDPIRLDPGFTHFPLQAFFFWLCVLALAAAVFMGAIATWRITGPVEALQRAAQRIAEGNLDVTVEAGARGEVGQLAQSFNTMTAKLKHRAAERQRLQRALEALTANLEPEATAAAALAALAEEPPAAASALYRRDPEREHIFLLAQARGDAARPFPVRLAHDPAWETLLAGRAGVILDAAGAEARGLPRQGDLLSDHLALVLPVFLADRTIGVAILNYGADVTRFELEEGLPVLNHLAGQIAVALENARLYSLAVADPLTGLYVESYFQNRLAEEVDRAQHRGGKLSLLNVELHELERLERSLGPRAVRNALVQLAREIKSESREMYVVARAGHSFFALLPETGAEEAAGFRERILRRVESLRTGDGDVARVHVHIGCATFPEGGRSPAILLDAAACDLAGARRRKVREALATPADGAGGEPSADLDLHPYVFQSPLMKQLLNQVARVAQSTASVLLLGETGSGKEVIADLLHRWSDRAHRPFVAINCSAVPETLLEAELFGYERGAFTGADRPRPGQLEAADGGTVFLDEVGDMPLAIQAKLLRVLQDRVVVRLGSRRPLEVDVRIVAATNRDLKALIESGGFRNDLYFRLKVVSLTVPPLRERREDIPALVDLFVSEFNRDNSRQIRGVSPAVLDRLHQYSWPGNVRELRNVLSRAMLMTDGDLVLPASLVFEGKASRSTRRKGDLALGKETAEGGPEAAAAEEPGPPNERQVKLLARLDGGATIRSRDYFDLVGVSPRTGLRDLNDLVARGLIIRLGSRRAATYRLVPRPGNSP
ncbi:MAG: sigma 54-interacting transcriptional regulator [Planctomycetes bacterium]|nr:sigma 54-interacting transcriptional regulator [Planctomycetota bacterium]